MLELTTEQENDLGSFRRNRFGDYYLYAVNRNAFNQSGARSVFETRYGEDLFEEDTLYILAGSDSGLLIDHVRARGVPSGSTYVFVELPDVKEKIHTRYPAHELPERVSVCTPEDAREHIYACNFTVYAHLDQIHIVRSLAVEDGFLTPYRDLCRIVTDWMDKEQWKFRAGFYSPGFISRQLENLAENQVPASVLRERFKGYTAVILAGGPSLDQALPWVQEHRENICIIAVSRICRRLQELGIRPDIVCSVDPYPISFDVSREMLNFWEDTLFASANHVTPLLSAQWRGRAVFLDDRFPWPNEIDRDNIPGRGPTVTNSAISLAIHMGFDQVVLCGVDLCFSAEGFTHAAGSNERQAGPLVAFIGHPVETNGGGEAETNAPFHNAIRELQKQAQDAGALGCTLINPAPAAARVKGVIHRTFDEITYTPVARPARAMIQSLVPEVDPRDRDDYYAAALKEMHRARHQASRVKQLAQKALSHVDGLFDPEGKRDFKHKLKMDRIEKQLNREFEAFGRLCKLFGMHEFVRIIRPDDEDTNWTDEQLEETSRAYYLAYLEGATRVLEVMKATCQRLESRIEEGKPDPDFSILFRQWELDGTPGRALVWEHFHSRRHAALAPETRGRLSSFIAEFQDAMTRSDTAHVERCHADARLKGAESKALEFFRNYDREGLERLVQGLRLRTEPEAILLSRLAGGLLAELRKDPDTALIEYQEIDQLPYLEMALTRITGIALDRNDLDNALEALALLSRISNNYMPHYADLLRMTGNVQEALDVYTAYLPEVPDDLATMTRLGLLYRELGVNEGAEWVFRHILEGDPANQLARTQLQEMESAV